MIVELTASDIQIIIDHFYVGRLQKHVPCEQYYEVVTNQGLFILFPLAIGIWRTEREKELLATVPYYMLQRQMLPDYHGVLESYSSYAYYQHLHYSLYKVIQGTQKSR